MLDSGLATVFAGDGWKGAPHFAPFNIIHVGAGAASMPQALVDQLAPGGKMVIPVGPQGLGQDYILVEKDLRGQVKQRNLMGVNYVPLVKV